MNDTKNRQSPKFTPHQYFVLYGMCMHSYVCVPYSLVKIGIDPPLIATEFFSLYITPIKCVDHHIKNALEYTKGKCRKLKGLCDIYEVFMKPYKFCCLHHINAS